VRCACTCLAAADLKRVTFAGSSLGNAFPPVVTAYKRATLRNGNGAIAGRSLRLRHVKLHALCAEQPHEAAWHVDELLFERILASPSDPMSLNLLPYCSQCSLDRSE
jgi:hypothetical protein